MNRVVSLIDGLNLYHGIRDCFRDARLLQCDVAALSRCFLKQHEIIQFVCYYSAYPHHLSQVHRRRYEEYTASLCAGDVRLVEGKFKRKGNTHEEKETDVNMALDMLDLAYRNEFDKCFVISGDSDLKPAVERVLGNFPQKSITILAPPGQHAKDFKSLRRRYQGRLAVMQIKRMHIQESILPA